MQFLSRSFRSLVLKPSSSFIRSNSILVSTPVRHVSTFIPKPSSTNKPSFSEILSALSVVIRFGAAAYVVQVYVANSTMSFGPSMLPTLNIKGDIIFTEYITPRLGLLKAGDVILATKPTDPSVTILKRIRGMPNDQIWIHPSHESHPILYTVPEDHVWLEGDNRHQSLDSRMYGPVPLALIHGKLWYRYWPLNQVGKLGSKVIDHTKTERSTSTLVAHAESQNDNDIILVNPSKPKSE